MEQASCRLMQALQDRGHSLSLISLHSLGPLTPRLRALGIKSIGLGYGTVPFWSWFLHLRSLLKSEKPDALILTGHNLFVLLAIGSFCRGRRVLAIHFHHSGVKPDWFWHLYYTLARMSVNAITFPSDFVRNEALSLCPQLKPKAFTLRNPIDRVAPISPEERCAARARYGLPPNGPVIGNAGWLIQRKRFDVFLRTAAALLQHKPNASFLIAGDGEERRRLELLAQELDITHALRWVGWISDMRSFYAAIDILQFNSDWDALPTTPIEAAVYGIPVVGSVLNSGLSEILRPGEDAFLSGCHDIEFLSKSCMQLLDDTSLAMSLARSAQSHVLSLSDPQMLAEWYERVLWGGH